MKSTKRTPENISEAIRMEQAGDSRRVIAEKFGISQTTVRQWIDPAYYRAQVAATLLRQKTNPPKQKRWCDLTQEQRDIRNAWQRKHYASSPEFRARMNQYGALYRSRPQGAMASRVRRATLGYAGRCSPIWLPFMRSVTGLTQQQFTIRFQGEGDFDHIIPLIAFDLCDPQQLVRACYIGNIHLIPRAINQSKGDTGRDYDVMSLPWIETDLALMLADTMISRVLVKLNR